MMVVIAESSRLRDRLEGDPATQDRDVNSDAGKGVGAGKGSNSNVPFTRKIVDFVRWYWGHEDTIPYADYMEIQQDKFQSGKGSEEVSLENDISTFDRMGQERIQSQLRDDLKVKVETDGDGEERFGTVSGNVPASDVKHIWNTIGGGASAGTSVSVSSSSTGSQDLTPKQLYVTFEDDEQSSDGNGNGTDNSSGFEGEYAADSEFMSGNEEFRSQSKELTNLTSIWSAWYHFPNANPTMNDSSASPTTTAAAPSSVVDPYQSSIEQLKVELGEMEKDLRDPYCIKDRDDMENEIRRVRKELGALKKERRMHKLKKMVSFSS